MSTETAVRKVSSEIDVVDEKVLPEERKTSWKRTGFSRMKLEWSPDEVIAITRVHREIRKLYTKIFSDLVELEVDLLLRVRMPELDEGEIRRDEYGYPVWKTTTTGAYIEDWQRMTSQEREGFLHRIYISLFDWERRRSMAHTEAMFAKAGWEEAFGEGYTNSEGRTERDREERGKLASMTERYFAIYKSEFFEYVRGQVAAVEKLGQRLKDVHQAASGR